MKKKLIKNILNIITITRILFVIIGFILICKNYFMFGIILYIYGAISDMLDGYFAQDAHHLNVNVLNREKLIAAMEDPTLYPSLTIRVSGYAVNFNKLSLEQKKEVISRTFHSKF